MRENVGFTESLLKPKKSSRILQDNAFSLDIEFYTCAHKVSIGQYIDKKIIHAMTLNSVSYVVVATVSQRLCIKTFIVCLTTPHVIFVVCNTQLS